MIVDFDESVKQLAERINEQWPYPELLRIWAICQMPDYEDGKATIGEIDLETIAKNVFNLNKRLKEAGVVLEPEAHQGEGE